MDSQLAAERKQLQHRREELNRLLDQEHTRTKEAIGKNDNLIELLNMELENLRLEFLNEEVKDSNPCESRGTNVQKGCCCLVIDQNDFHPTSCSSKAMADYMLVKNTKEFYTKMEELETRNQELGCCKCGCCHSLASLIVRDTCACLDSITSVLLFSFLFGWLLYLMGALLLTPFICIYRCFQWCFSCCYRKGTRTDRVLEIYRKYNKEMTELYGIS